MPETSTQLAEIEARLATALSDAADALVAIGGALGSPTSGDRDAIATDARALRTIGERADTELLAAMAVEGPTASDLRLVLALTQLAQVVGLIANQFDLINEQLVEIELAGTDQPGTAGSLTQMATLAADQIRAAVGAFLARNVPLAETVNDQDDGVDRMNREVFEATLALDATPAHRELALRHVLIARSLERVADNAVDIAEQTPFLVDDELRQFTDASHPYKLP